MTFLRSIASQLLCSITIVPDEDKQPRSNAPLVEVLVVNANGVDFSAVGFLLYETRNARNT